MKVLKEFKIGHSRLTMKPGTIIFTDGMMPENLKCLAAASDLICDEDYLFADNLQDAEKLIELHGMTKCYLFEFREPTAMRTQAYYADSVHFLFYENGIYYLCKRGNYTMAMM